MFMVNAVLFCREHFKSEPEGTGNQFCPLSAKGHTGLVTMRLGQ
jgi:hypothetical protein